MAVSDDGGRSFKRLNDGVYILAPDPLGDGYGVGQPGVAQGPDGLFYMIYTDAPGNGIQDTMGIIRSAEAAFPPASIQTVAKIPATALRGYSADLAFDDASGEFLVIANSSAAPMGPASDRRSTLTLSALDATWSVASQTTLTLQTGWTFGEGVALLKDGRGHLLRQTLDNELYFVVAGSTWELAAFTDLWAPWVAGDLKYAVIKAPW